MAGIDRAHCLGVARVVGTLLVLGAVAGEAHAQNALNLAENCTSVHRFGTAWSPASPSISSSAQVGDVLAYRTATLTTSFEHNKNSQDNADERKHELVVAAMWQSGSRVTPQGWAPTNVPGISMLISMQGHVLTPTGAPVVMAKYSLQPGRQGVDTPFTKQLVLSVPPDRLPVDAGAMKVTGFGAGVGLILYAVNLPKDAYAVGQTIASLPSFPENPRACAGANEPAYTGGQIMGLGAGGSDVFFSNACEVGLTQTKEVLMGNYSIREFPSQGSASGARPFDITLSQCSVLARPKISFTAKHGASPDKTVLNLDPNVDAQEQPVAQGFGIIMINDATNQRIEFGKTYDMKRVDADGAQIRLRASYLRTASSPAQMAGGHANGTAEFTIDFP